MKPAALAVLALVALCAVPTRVQAQSTAVVNGGFEQDLTGWTASGNVFSRTSGWATAADGTKLAVFNDGNAVPNGLVKQTVTTVVGKAYTLTASIGAVSVYGTNPMSMRLSAMNGTVVLASLDVSVDPTAATNYVVKTLLFTATSTATTLAFQDTTADTNSTDLALDKISLTSTADPPPTTDPCASGTQPVLIQGVSPKVVWQQVKQRPRSPTDSTLVDEVVLGWTWTIDAAAPIDFTIAPVTTCPNGLFGYVWPVPAGTVLGVGNHSMTLSGWNNDANGVRQSGAVTVSPFVVAESAQTAVLPPTAPLSVRIVP